MILTKDIMNSLPLVASVLGERYGVEVRFGGDSAYTDGNIIQLPGLPLDGGDTLLALARGFLDHEAAHIRHTDFTALKNANLTPLEKHIWNCLEDWRVEHALAERYPGCGHNFRWLIRHEFLEKTNEAGSKNPAFSVLNWLLLTLRSWDVPELKTQCDHEARIVESAYPGLLQRLANIMTDSMSDSTADMLNKIPRHGVSTEDCLTCAKRIAALLKDVAEVPKENTGQSADSTDSDSNETQGAPHTIQPHAHAISQTARNQLLQLLNSQAESLPQALGERLAKKLNALHQDSPHDSLKVAVLGTLPADPLSPALLEQSARSCRALRTRLQGLLQAQTLERCVSGRHGALDPKRLHRLAAQNPRVFLQRGYRQSLDTAVHILLDVFGSMSSRMELASAACHAVASALHGMGVNVAVSAFPADFDAQNTSGVFPVLKHGQTMHHNFALRAGGSTPLGESLWWVMQRMLPLKEARKLIFVITDGAPNKRPPVQKAIAQAHKLGMEVYGIGIDEPSVGTLFPRWCNVAAMNDLAPALFYSLQETLLRPERT